MHRLKNLWRLFLVIYIGLCLSACATQEQKPDESELESPFPEIRELQFTGNETFYSWSLERVMSSRPRPLLQFWKKGDPYNPSNLKDDMLRLRKFYFDRGFLSAKARVADVQKDEENNSVELVIDIEEGPETRVNSISFEGEWPNTLPSKDQVLEDLSMQRGQRPQQRKLRQKQITTSTFDARGRLCAGKGDTRY